METNFYNSYHSDIKGKMNSNMIAKYNQTRIDVDNIKQKISEQKAGSTKKTDEVCISEEGKTALEEKMIGAHYEAAPHIRGKLSNISSQYYVDAFGEKLIASEKSKDMDAYFQKMKTIHNEMQEKIEEKYDNSEQEEVYFISKSGGIELLTKDKELEMLDSAYESHKSLMLNSLKIWESWM